MKKDQGAIDQIKFIYDNNPDQMAQDINRYQDMLQDILAALPPKPEKINGVAVRHELENPVTEKIRQAIDAKFMPIYVNES